MGKKGFTLIELLITISIAAIILGISVSSYRDFQAKQELIQAAKTALTNIRLAQSQGYAGVKPSAGCTELNGWYFQRNNATTYETGSHCKPGAVQGHEKSYSLPRNITVAVTSGPSCILFRTVNRGVGTCSDSPSASGMTATFTSTLTSIQPKITVTSAGDISYAEQ